MSSKYTLLPIEGIRSLRAFNAFNKLLLGMKMLPANLGEAYESFYKRVGALPIEEQYKEIRAAVALVDLEEEEVQAIVSFTADGNGIPYGPAQLKRMSPDFLLDLISAVCLEFAKMKIDLLTESEKKN